jgi:hypothetical protein
VTWRGLVALAAIALLTACAPVVSGRGRVGGSGTTAAPRPSATASKPTGPTSVVTVPSGDNLRTPVTTAIGDPVTADLCTAIGLGAMRNFPGGLTPVFDSRQFPPGCSVSLREGTKAVLGVTVYAASGRPTVQRGRTSRSASGQRIYSYPFAAATGDCRRELAPGSVLLTVDSLPSPGAKPNADLDCAATDAMADRLAAVLATRHIPRLHLASPTLTRFDACAVSRASGITTTLAAFSNGTFTEQGFGASCEVRTTSLFLFFNFVLAADAQPPGSTQTTEFGHLLFQSSAQPNLCSYVSTQRRTPDGRYEQMTATATVRSSTQVTDLCTQTAQALALYLSAAGLN